MWSQALEALCDVTKKVSIAEIHSDNAEQWITDINDPLSTFIYAGFVELPRLLDKAEIII